MSSNFTPEKIVKTTGSDGTKYTSEVYSLEAWANLNFLGFLMILVGVGLFAPFVSAILLLYYCTIINSSDKYIINILAIAASLYMLIDFHEEWLISKLVIFFNAADEINKMIFLNSGILLTSVITLFLGSTLFEWTSQNKWASFFCILTFSIFSYFIAMFVIDNNYIKIIP